LGQDIDYYVYFQDGSGELAPEYYEDKGTLSTADPITITLGLTRTINSQLDIAHPPLIGVGIGSGSVTTSTNPVNGQVIITVPNGQTADLTLSYTPTCTGTVSAVIAYYNDQSYPMTDNGAGQYQVTIPASAITVSSDITITTTCDGSDTTVTVGTVVLYDPSGIITDAHTGQPIEGAKVTLYHVPNWLPRTGPLDTRPNTCESNNSKPPGQPWSQPAPTELGIMVNVDQMLVAPLVNIQHTNDVGYYGWDVPYGCWYVVVEADGYLSRTSPVVGVPPEVVDLDMTLIDPSSWTDFVYIPIVIR
jgi:hypothetical protein